MDLSKGLTLMGDSAGANLALCLATLIRDGLDANLEQAGEAERTMKVHKLVLVYPVLFAMSQDEEADAKLQKDFVEEVRQNDYLILSYPIYEGYNGFYLGKDRAKRKELERSDRRVSPILAGMQDLPPTLIITAGDDFLSFQSDALEKALKEANTPVEHVTYEQPHGFFSLLYLKEHKDAIKRSVEFLELEA